MGVKEMRAQTWIMLVKMTVEILGDLLVVRYLGQKLTVKTWKGLEYDWGFWPVFVGWCLGQE